MTLLEVTNISKLINDSMEISNINFSQQKLQKIAIAGESGAGKTTLLKMISGHTQPNSGNILFNGRKVIGPNEKLIPGHPQIAYLSQHYELHHNYRVEELIWFENHLSEKAATELFTICEIDHLLKRKTDQLSGGERQRIALCMLLVKSPLLLVLDEPFSNLDLIHKNILKNILEDVHERLKITIIIASHDPSDTLSWADEILVMRNGKIIQQGTPEEIYYKPIDEYVAGLFGTYNLLSKEQLALFNINLSEKKSIIVRPESFIISLDKKQGIKAIVQKINFYGSCFSVEVIVNELKIFVNAERKLKENDEIFLQLNADKTWYID